MSLQPIRGARPYAGRFKAPSTLTNLIAECRSLVLHLPDDGLQRRSASPQSSAVQSGERMGRDGVRTDWHRLVASVPEVRSR